MRMLKCKGGIALVDDEDFEYAKRFRWYIFKSSSTSYAYRRLGQRARWFLHWEIAGKPDKGFVVDHRDGNGLNNQKYNLRTITVRQNGQNKHSKKTSQFPGVYKKGNKWVSQIVLLGEQVYLGSFDTELEAYEKYKGVCEQLDHGGVVDNTQVLPEILVNPEMPYDEDKRLRTLMRKDGLSEEEIEAYFKK